MTTTYRAQPDGISQIIKSPTAILDYPVDWLALGWLQTGETIIDHTVTAATGIMIQSHTATASVVTVWLAGGALGTIYLVTVSITTSAGRQDSRSFRVQIVQR